MIFVSFQAKPCHSERNEESKLSVPIRDGEIPRFARNDSVHSERQILPGSRYALRLNLAR